MSENQIFKCSKCATPCFSIGVLYPEGCLYGNLEGKWEDVSNEYMLIPKKINQLALGVKSEWDRYIEGRNKIPQANFWDNLGDLLKNITGIEGK